MALEVVMSDAVFAGFPIVVMDELREKHPERFTDTGAMDHKWFETTIRPKYHIYIRRDKNSIAFTLQNGPIKEVGVNGCQVDAMIDAARDIITGHNGKFYCAENDEAIKHLGEALRCLEQRRLNREKRGVEGHNKV